MKEEEAEVEKKRKVVQTPENYANRSQKRSITTTN